MHVELILEEPALVNDSSVVEFEPFRRTSWGIWSRGQLLAVSGRSYRHRKDALAALEQVTGGRVVFENVRGRRVPVGLTRYRKGTPYVPIERVL